MRNIYLTYNADAVSPAGVDIGAHNFYIGESLMFRVTLF